MLKPVSVSGTEADTVLIYADDQRRGAVDALILPPHMIVQRNGCNDPEPTGEKR